MDCTPGHPGTHRDSSSLCIPCQWMDGSRRVGRVNHTGRVNGTDRTAHFSYCGDLVAGTDLCTVKRCDVPQCWSPGPATRACPRLLSQLHAVGPHGLFRSSPGSPPNFNTVVSPPAYQIINIIMSVSNKESDIQVRACRLAARRGAAAISSGAPAESFGPAQRLKCSFFACTALILHYEAIGSGGCPGLVV